MKGMVFMALAAMTKTETVTVIALCACIALFLAVDVVLLVLIRKLNKNVAAPEAEPPVELVTPDMEIKRVQTEDGIMKTYDFSFSARLNQADESAQVIYGRLKNAILSYRNVNDYMAWEHETFSYGGKAFAKLSIQEGVVTVCLSIQPADPRLSGLNVQNVSRYELYEFVPSKITVPTFATADKALALIASVAAERKIPVGAAANIDYRESKKSVKSLELLGLIREYNEKEEDKNTPPDGSTPST